MTENRSCQNCKQNFILEQDDFEFFKKFEVPAPTFCPLCRFQRRLMMRNERVMYKRDCDLCGKSIISIIAADKPNKVYCQPCWWSDKWDALEYGQDYDPSQKFFDQFRELLSKVPYPALYNGYATLVNSEYVNHAGNSKNCYFIFNADYNDDVHYSTMVNHAKDSMDALAVSECELCYWIINCRGMYRSFFSEDCRDCHEVYFSKNLNGCNNCFGCINLTNKSYYFFNEPLSKEEYEKKLANFQFNSYKTVESMKKEALSFWQKHPHKFMHGKHNVNISGDYIDESKNAHFMYMCRFVEDGKYCQHMTLAPIKDVYDVTEWGNGVQRAYDTITIGEDADNIKFCFGTWSGALNIEYSFAAVSSSDIFGSACVRKKQYCILNKQYSKEDYEKLRAGIIEDMNASPYIDERGRVFKYGEFFPYDLSIFDYNESTAAQYFRLSKEEVINNGWRWREPASGSHQATLPTGKIADSIKNIDDSILKEVLGCSECNKPFRLTKAEFDLLREFNLSVPRKCADCRHMERMSRLNPPQLWDRECAKCGTDIKTSYAPDRPEIVYCEQCYNSEAV